MDTAIPRLPGYSDGPNELVALADAHGDAAVYSLIRLCRRGHGRDVAGEAMTTLARRAPGPAPAAGHRAVVTRLPGYGDGPDKLVALADAYGAGAVRGLIRLCRRGRNDPGGDAGAAALTTLARRMVATEMRLYDLDRDQAKRNVADRLGYTPPLQGNGRAAFYKIHDGKQSIERRTGYRRRMASR